MYLMYKIFRNGKVHAYFDGLSDFYGEGNSKESALHALLDKVQRTIDHLRTK